MHLDLKIMVVERYLLKVITLPLKGLTSLIIMLTTTMKLVVELFILQGFTQILKVLNSNIQGQTFKVVPFILMEIILQFPNPISVIVL